MKGKNKKKTRRVRREKRPPTKARVISKLSELKSGKTMIGKKPVSNALTELLSEGMPRSLDELRQFDRNNPYHP